MNGGCDCFKKWWSDNILSTVASIRCWLLDCFVIGYVMFNTLRLHSIAHQERQQSHMGCGCGCVTGGQGFRNRQGTNVCMRLQPFLQRPDPIKAPRIIHYIIEAPNTSEQKRPIQIKAQPIILHRKKLRPAQSKSRFGIRVWLWP